MGDKRNLKNDIKIGDKFGLWTVIGESKKTDSSYNKYYVCQCICGTLRNIQRSKLISGHTKSCGCRRKLDMTGKIAKDLLFLEPVGLDGTRVVWKCQCLKCGRICERTVSDAKRIGTCGHHSWTTLKENGKRLIKIDGTVVQTLNQKKSKNNKSGVKGVHWDKTKGKWTAQITFKGKNYYLGRYDDIEDAARARKAAEAELFEPILKKYEKTLKSTATSNDKP